MSKVRIAIVGLGGMGRRWAEVANSYYRSNLNLIIDSDEKKLEEVKEYWKCNFDSDLKALSSPKIDAVEIKENILLAKCQYLSYMVGFNHRFHPALAQAKQMVSSGAIGKIHFIRSVYGHGGRIGYENEWRNKPELAGGGELLDQGIHLIDLAFWFLLEGSLGGSFEKVHGTLASNFWSSEIEDNAFIILQNRSEATVSLHVSSTQWQKKFLWEIYGERGFIAIEGLGGNYGIETLRYRNRGISTSKLDQEEIFYFPPQFGYEDPDISLFSLWGKFISSIKSGKEYGPGGSDALNALNVIEKIYQEQGAGKGDVR